MSMLKDRRHDTVKNSFILNGLILVENTSDSQTGFGTLHYFFFCFYYKTKIDIADLPGWMLTDKFLQELNTAAPNIK